MQDGHRTSINSAALTADEVARRNFPIVRKGFDPTDVRMFLDSIAEQLQALHDREDDLRRRLANAERLVAHPEMDEAVLTAALGEETTRVLRSAHDAAGDMKARAEEGASQMIHLAHEEAARIRAEGERAAADRSSEADVTVAQIRAGAAAEADSVIEAARQESQAMMAGVQEECRGMVREAQEVRARVLSDLVRRRRALYGQVEQLRGGRQSLVEALREARRSFDHILETLQRDFDTGSVAQQPASDEVVTETSAPAATDGAGGRPESKARQEDSPESAAGPGDGAETTAASGPAPEPGADTPTAPPSDETGASATGLEGRPASAAGPEGHPDDGGTPGPDGRPEATPGPFPNRRRAGLRVIRRSRSAPTDENMRPDASVDEAAPSGETEQDEGVRIIASSRGAVDDDDATSGVAGDVQEEHRPTSPARSRGRTRGRHRAPGSSAIDELFAKVRAGRSAPENRPRTRRKGSGKEPEVQSSSVAPQPPPEQPEGAEESTSGPDARPEDTAAPEAGPETTAAPDVAPETTPAPEAGPEDTAAPEAGPEDTAAPEAGPEDTSDPDARSDQGRETGPEGSFLRRRDDTIGPITVALSRRLKRALQDDQNELLDRLRGRGERTLVEILPPVAEHHEHFRSAGVELLDRAEKAGSSFLRGPARDGAAARNAAAGNGDGEKRSLVLADELATAIIDPLRRRLERSLGSAADPDEASLVENLGGAYREWKGSRIERVAGDHVVAAFSQGELGVARPGTVLRWIVDDGDERCPDCDDNALAGPLPRGARYPTGQAHPPAHSGCRCLLAPPPA